MKKIGVILGGRWPLAMCAVSYRRGHVSIIPLPVAEMLHFTRRAEDVPNSVELRWRSGEHQAAHTWSLCTADLTGWVNSCSRAARTVGRLQVTVDAAELLAGLGHAGGAPAQRDLSVAPPFDVAGVRAADRDHRLDGVGAQQPARDELRDVPIPLGA